jgi:TPR repeat protein
MAHENSTVPSGTAQDFFAECINRGDDFFKIQLLRQAKYWYSKALALNTNNEDVKQKVAECERLLAYENKVVAILGIIAAVLVVAYFLFFN